RNDDANRAGPGGGFDVDAVGLVFHGHRHVVPSAGGHAAHADDQGERLFFVAMAKFFEVMEQEVAGRNRTAGRIHAEHNADHIVVLTDAVDLFFNEAALGFEDGAFDMDHGDLFLAAPA